MLDWISVLRVVGLGRSSCLRHLVLLYVTLGELEEATDVICHWKPFIRREIARALVESLVVMLLGNDKARRNQVLSVKQFGIPTVCLTVALLESPLHPRRVLQLALFSIKSGPFRSTASFDLPSSFGTGAASFLTNCGAAVFLDDVQFAPVAPLV